MALPGESAPTVIGAVAFPERLVGPAQVHVQRGAALHVQPDVPIDRLVTDREDLVAREPADDLLRAEVLPAHGLDARPIGGAALRVPARAGPAPVRESRVLRLSKIPTWRRCGQG